MHPDILLEQARFKMSDDRGSVERSRRERLARPTPQPDAVILEPRIEHLSFAARVRAILDILHPANGHPVGTAHA